MFDKANKIVVYTTIYPGVETYISDWYRSVQAQTDRDFQLWIGLDGIGSETVESVIGSHLEARWVASEPGDTPARIRQRALAQIVNTCDAVVLVDIDDILHETRVAAAREVLATSELYGCALRLVNQQGRDLGMTFSLPSGTKAEEVLPRHNVFGLSNTAYQSALLQRCLPVPTEVTLVDWFLATKAWLMGARLAFDPVVRMDYRQHGANMARVRFPISPKQVIKDTELVRHHFEFMLALDPSGFLPERLVLLKNTASSIETFHQHIVPEPSRLLRYVESLNSLAPAPLWWSSVAHPALESMWQTTA
jgi:hypothetical protein